ncbi:MAG: hypothetical protein ACLUI3_13520 [Christensenellales bacterium]
MIRKILSVLFGLLILAVAARAETGEEIALAAYPGYVVASSDSGNGFGVFALENGNETALCIVEDGRLTIANERAFKAEECKGLCRYGRRVAVCQIQHGI